PSGGSRPPRAGDRRYPPPSLPPLPRHAVVSARSCIPLPAGTDTDVAALVGCAVTTGVGAVINRAKIEPGCSVAVFGAGGVGLSAIMAARPAGARNIIVVRPSSAPPPPTLHAGPPPAPPRPAPPLPP